MGNSNLTWRKFCDFIRSGYPDTDLADSKDFGPKKFFSWDFDENRSQYAVSDGDFEFHIEKVLRLHRIGISGHRFGRFRAQKFFSLGFRRKPVLVCSFRRGFRICHRKSSATSSDRDIGTPIRAISGLKMFFSRIWLKTGPSMQFQTGISNLTSKKFCDFIRSGYRDTDSGDFGI